MTPLERDIARALDLAPEALGIGSPIRFETVPDRDTLLDRFAADMLAEYRAALAAGRARVLFILPVGPTGQYERLAALCNQQGQDLRQLVLINMDEYLAPDGTILPPSHRLSFRGHLERQLLARLAPGLAPPPDQHLVPDPRDLAAIPDAIDRWGGVDACFGGVGVTGHLAFNDPPEPGEPDDPDGFARLPTRVVTLSRETVLVNAMNALGGNRFAMPRCAATIGMREILGARKLRLFLHRPYAAAVLRLLLHGPITATVPASLAQRHSDAAALATVEATRFPS